MPVIPAAMIIESAVDSLKNLKVDDPVLVDQAKELHEAVGDTSDDFIKGYNLGLEVARLMIQTSPALLPINTNKIL